MKKKHAFTLAETLITLAIIGVIAALTIPTLMVKYNKKVVETKLLKFYSQLSQAIKISERENGSIADYVSASDEEKMKFFLPYLKTNKLCTKEGDCEEYNALRTDGKSTVQVMSYPGAELADGTRYTYWSTGCSHDYGCFMVVFDINGKKGPNIAGKDVFWYRLKTTPEGGAYIWHYPKTNAETLCKTEKTSGHSGLYCTDWIMQNKFKIPDDYPWL